ncbi:hypothetical protein Poli38472_001753 [Pythium oligandrum]|uniref:Uncharacterized protein n=1 Tax=Pythium oligandrum TaxID=41045 RepID=A0A8K1CVD5_PYTOL|nr:hypothetical protein Poli38472_001753 [Pythium oligandrum]|eukprot:TMW69597.1 hypothetical protein Poli38472_001753 [Pythium oligandrum]
MARRQLELRVQQMREVDQLETTLEHSLRTVRDGQTQIAEQMDAMRLLIQGMLMTESKAKDLYLDETRMEMQALRNVMQVEMESTRNDIVKLLETAKQNVTATRAEYDNTRAEAAQKLKELKARRKEREQQHMMEIAQIKQDAAMQIAQLQEDIQMEAERVRQLVEQSALDHANVTQESLGETELLTPSTQTPSWVVLVFAALCIVALLGWLYSRQLGRKHQRVLYSKQLKSHFSSDEPTATQDVRPTLLRHTRQSHPASSTSSFPEARRSHNN